LYARRIYNGVMSVPQPQRRANVLEIIGAWLHIWVPPRDAVVPPIPWKKLALGFAAGAVVVGIALAILIPRINTSKAQTAARDAAERRQALAKNRARITREQAPHHGAAVSLLPAAHASAAEQAAAKAKLMDHVRADIVADAHARAAAGEMHDVVGEPECQPTPGTTDTGTYGVYDCFLETHAVPAGTKNVPGAIGYPFRAVVDFKTYTYNWCKTENIPGELMIQAPKDVTLLPPACQKPTAR
jgi:hypothetical protein